jgi:hypothetical protein
MFLNVVLLAGLSLAMLCTVGRLRGHLHFADAFFPLLVLGLGQWESLLIQYALNLVGSTVVAGVFLLLLAGSGPHVSPRRTLLMAGCLVLLPLFGASGLVLVPALAVWLAWVGLGHCRTADVSSRRLGLLVLGFVAAALLLSGLYLVGLRGGPPTAKPSPTLAHGLEVLAQVFGAPGLAVAPWKSAVMPAALLSSGAVWLGAWVRRPAERIVLLGFLAFLLGMGCLAGAVAWGRTEIVPRHATLLLPLGCCLYFLWARYGGTSLAPTAQVILLLLAALAFTPNLRSAMDNGRTRRLALHGFEANLACRVPPAVLAECGADRVFPAACKESVGRSIAGLRDAGAAAFKALPEDVSLRVAALPTSVVSLHDLLETDGVARPTGGDPAVEVALPRAEFVHAIRLHYAYANILGSPDLFTFSWHQGASDVGPETAGPKVLLEAGPDDGGERTVTVVVNRRIDGFRMVPRIKMFTLRLVAVELLLPEETGPGPP